MSDATKLYRTVPQWLIGALLLAFAITWFSFGHVPLFDEDEGEYAEVAVEMARSGDFITPTLNGQPFFEKPILAFWLQAPLAAAFGAHAWVFRLPSLIACLLWVVALVRFGRRSWDVETGWFAGFLCATSIGVVVSAGAAAMDGVLCLLMALAGFDIFRAWQDESPASRWAVRRAFLWMALGFLAKGPVAIVVPFFLSLSFYVLQGDFRRWLRAVLDLPGWIVLLGIALPWYLAQYHLMGQPFIDYFLLRENVGRLTGALQGHGGSILYYFPVLVLIVLPHTAMLARAGVESWHARSDPLTRFLLLWFVVVFVLFSLATTKLPHYLLIGLTPLFLLMAHHRARLQSWGIAIWPWVLMAGGALALPAAVSWAAAHSHNLYLQEMLGQGPKVFGAGYWGMVSLEIIGTLLVIGWLRAWLKAGPWRLLAITGVASNLMIWTLLLPAAAHLQQDPVLEAARVAGGWSQRVVADNRMPSFAVYSGRPTVNRTPGPGDLVFLRADAESRLPPHAVLFSRGGLRLVRIYGQ
ncbi:MAG: glycosyltransferase family 39 protein [Betaproteobacteria bacterium]|nr:glycosyltransferase family 39 protein [Betaproteobacteria bacterium]MDE2622987.1 glycosyltransferase family 39 protein [Betaproteobacteria bacterium]